MTKNKSHNTSLKSAQLPQRIKAFIVDMFMIMMPIMYLTTYVFMEGKEDFQSSQPARWATALIFGCIVILFWKIKGQTPGYKAYEVKLVDNHTGSNVSWIKAILRYILFLVSAMTIFLACIPFFRKDRKTIQDLLTQTTVIDEK